MSARLIELGEQPEDRREILIAGEEFLIGRGADCDLRLNDGQISRHHCQLRRTGDDYVLLDLGSSNGTYLNGQRVISQNKVKTGDEIRVGGFRFQFDLEEREGIQWGTSQPIRPEDRTIKVPRVQTSNRPAADPSQPSPPAETPSDQQ